MTTGQIWQGLDGDRCNGHVIGRECTPGEMAEIRARTAAQRRALADRGLLKVEVKAAFLCSCGIGYLVSIDARSLQPLFQLAIKGKLVIDD